MFELKDSPLRSTSRVMLWGFFFSFFANIPFYAWIFSKDWSWSTGFPLGWIGAGMVYMGTFFHEIGHTLCMWFYGYPTIPTFDFQHGGGMAWALSGQQIPILFVVWGALGYGLWVLKDYRYCQIGLCVLAFLNISLAFTDLHSVASNFMGPAFECLIGAFFLYRALFNLAPRGVFERFLNGFFGFGLIGQVFINSYGLLKSDAFRLVYYEQKGSHGFGDFDKIASSLTFLNFEGTVCAWVLLNVLCLVLPFILFLRSEL